jgi:L-ascorbate metabolism protein UlaG (beta-lactamase superfamily)
MKIKKLGHCCLLLTLEKLTILTDPGAYSTAQNTLTGIDVVLITHEHADHFHLESVKEVLAHNPSARIFTNKSVGGKLAAAGITFELLEDANSIEVNGIKLQAVDTKHEEIFEDWGQVQNTGYVINDKLFHPGDASADPGQAVEILALPIAGPWCRIADALHYALRLKPKIIFPVHDGMIRSDRIIPLRRVTDQILTQRGITFIPLGEEEETDLA